MTVRVNVDGTLDVTSPRPRRVTWAGEIKLAGTPSSTPPLGQDLGNTSRGIETTLAKLEAVTFVDHFGDSYSVHIRPFGTRSLTPVWDAASNALYYGMTLIGEAAFTPPPPAAHTLTLGHTGQGINPVADPTNSEGYEAGQYLENEAIDLSGAVPDEGYQIDSWTGTSDDSSTGDTNSLVMPDEAHEVKVNYVEIPPEPSGMFKMTIPGNGYFTGFAHVDLSNDTGIDWGDGSELQVLTAPYDNGVEHEYAEGEWYANIS